MYIQRRTSSLSAFGGFCQTRGAGVNRFTVSASADPTLTTLVRCLRQFMQLEQRKQFGFVQATNFPFTLSQVGDSLLSELWHFGDNLD